MRVIGLASISPDIANDTVEKVRRKKPTNGLIR